MRIDEIEIEYFGRYCGKAEVDLGSGQTPVVVVHGDNMAGKTTILNAVRWALYGEAKGSVRRKNASLSSLL